MNRRNPLLQAASLLLALMMSLVLTACGGGGGGGSGTGGGGGAGGGGGGGTAPKAWGAAALIPATNIGVVPADYAQDAKIVFDRNGNALAVWDQTEDLVHNLWANRYTAGSGWGTAERIEYNVGNALSPDIAFDASGNAVVVWKQFDGTAGNGAPLNSIWSNRFIAGTGVGSGWGTATWIADGANRNTSPKVAFDINGNALAVWYSESVLAVQNGVLVEVEYQRIVASRYTATSGWGAAAPINNGASNAYRPRIAFDLSGNALAVWDQGADIWANRYTVGVGWGAAGVIESGTSPAYYPEIAFDLGGNALAAWVQTSNVWVNSYAPGTGWVPANAATIENAGGVSGLDVAFDALGNALVVWSRDDGSENPTIWSNRFIAGTGPGTGWGTAEMIETIEAGTRGAFSPQVAFDADGHALAVWVQENAENYWRNDVWSNRYTAGVGWGTAERIETGAGNASYPQIAIDANGNAMAVWTQNDGTRNRIWFNRYE
jgi:hypothetical protein